MFGETGNIKEEFIMSIEASIVQREKDICDTWDAVKVMSLPWGVNQSVEPEKATEVTEFVASLKDQSITLPSNNVISVIKADVKDRKGKYLLIVRYEITQRA